MEHLVDHLRDDLVPPFQREHIVVPEVVGRVPSDVNKIKLVGTVFTTKWCDDAVLSVTDDRRVVSDCVDLIESGGCLVPVSIDR